MTILVAAGAAATPAYAGEWSLIGRYTQGTILYRGTERDSGFHTSATSIVDWIGGTAQWRERPMGASQKWKMGVSLSVDLLRQQVFGVPHAQPRASLRFSYGRYTQFMGTYGIAPMVELHGGQYSIFKVTGPAAAQQQTLVRAGPGFGLNLTLRWRPWRFARVGKEFLELNAHGLMRLDSGAYSSVLGSYLLPSAGFEAGASAQVTLWRGTMLEFRYRGMQETFQWRPVNGQSQNSELTNFFSLFDFGIGIRY